MISQIRQVRDIRSSASDYAPPWARGADRAREQHFEPANLAVGPRHAVVEVTHQLPLEPGRDWQGADRGLMSLRLIALQMGVVSGIAALVAWAFISIFGPKSPANDTVQLRQSPLATTASSVSSAGGESRTELSPANPAPQTTAGPRQTPAGPTAPTMARSLATAAESLVPPAAATTANPTKTPAAPAPSSTTAQAEAAPAPPITASPAQAEAAPAPTIAASPAQAEVAPAPSAEAARINITAEPAPSQLPSRTETASASASPMATADTGHGLGTDELASLVKRAQGFINAGDFSAARLLLRRAAEAGSAEAALALGATFDPDFLRKSRAVGIDPDVGRARQWYRKAVDLGSPVAAKQLDSLPQAH